MEPKLHLPDRSDCECSAQFHQFHPQQLPCRFLKDSQYSILIFSNYEGSDLILSIIYYFKVFSHLTPFNPTIVFTIYTPEARSRSELPYLQKSIHASKRQLSTFFLRNVDAWNALPASMRSSSSIPAFKRFSKQLDLSVLLKDQQVTKQSAIRSTLKFLWLLLTVLLIFLSYCQLARV
jgi:hypothetical protein